MAAKDTNVKAGDLVKVKFGGWETSEFVEAKDYDGNIYVESPGGWSRIYLSARSVEVVEHRPNIDRLNKDVKEAQEALRAAQEALTNAGGTLPSPEITVGSRVRSTNGARRLGTVEIHDRKDSILPYFVKFDGDQFSGWRGPDEVEAV